MDGKNWGNYFFKANYQLFCLIFHDT